MLIVTNLDRLGRNAMDVRQTVEQLAATGIRVHCLALGDVDLTSAAGKMTMQVLGAVAEFERDLLIERMQSGLQGAKTEGKRLGRPEAVDTTYAVQKAKAKNMTQAQVAAELKIGIATVKRHWNKSSQLPTLRFYPHYRERYTKTVMADALKLLHMNRLR